MRLSGNNKNICQIGKNHLVKNPLKSMCFSLLWKLTKMPTFKPIFSSSSREKHSQADWLSLTFSCKRELLLGIQWTHFNFNDSHCIASRTSECKELKHMKEIYRLTFWKEMLCCSFEFVPQVRFCNIVLGSKERTLTGPLTLDRTWKAQCSPEPAVVGPLSNAEFAYHPHLKVDISAF